MFHYKLHKILQFVDLVHTDYSLTRLGNFQLTCLWGKQLICNQRVSGQTFGFGPAVIVSWS